MFSSTHPKQGEKNARCSDKYIGHAGVRSARAVAYHCDSVSPAVFYSPNTDTVSSPVQLQFLARCLASHMLAAISVQSSVLQLANSSNLVGTFRAHFVSGPQSPSCAIHTELMIADNPVELQVGMPPTDQLSTNATITCDFDVLEEFLEEMKAFDCQPATSTPARKGCSKRSTKRSKQPYKNPNPVWKRRKEELRNLRIETKELETQVAFLRLRDTHAKLFDECMGTTKGQELWKAAAKREREGYQQAQAENSHLKQSIKRYKKISDTLQAALENVENNASSLQGEMRIVHGLRLLGTTVFNRLECRVQARLQELDTFLHDNRTIAEAGDTDQIRIYQQESLHPVSVVEFTRNRLMPFSAEKTSTSVWDIMKLGDFLNEKLISTPSEDDMASEGWYNQPLKCGGTAMLRSHCLKKRVAIPGGFAVLVEAISEWSAYPTSSAPWRYVTRDTGWAFVYPLDTNGSTSMCRVQTLLRLTTADSNEAVTGNQHIAQTQLTTSVGEVVITSFREMIQSRHQLLENALLDSSRTSAACTLSG